MVINDGDLSGAWIRPPECELSSVVREAQRGVGSQGPFPPSPSYGGQAGRAGGVDPTACGISEKESPAPREFRDFYPQSPNFLISQSHFPTSPQNPLHHLAMNIRQAEVAALEAVGEAFVVET